MEIKLIALPGVPSEITNRAKQLITRIFVPSKELLRSTIILQRNVQAEKPYLLIAKLITESGNLTIECEAKNLYEASTSLIRKISGLFESSCGQQAA